MRTSERALRLAAGLREHSAGLGPEEALLVAESVLGSRMAWAGMGFAPIGSDLSAGIALLRTMGRDVMEPMPPFVDREAPWA